ncbi:hypothetical protein [Methylobacterium aquaticum]|uniref:hypothetical protein n=1 Tax=Methylobacterium aquaticum TaxID=270351 RepID=UPI000A6C9376|nr:hypothetical protein [Methylobacterium aquaticum]
MSEHTLRRLREARDSAEAAREHDGLQTALIDVIDALIADRRHESKPPASASPAAYQQAGRRDVLHELRAWHESQAADCYGGANDAHTASIAEIDRLMEVEKAKS